MYSFGMIQIGDRIMVHQMSLRIHSGKGFMHCDPSDRIVPKECPLKLIFETRPREKLGTLHKEPILIGKRIVILLEIS